MVRSPKSLFISHSNRRGSMCSCSSVKVQCRDFNRLRRTYVNATKRIMGDDKAGAPILSSRERCKSDNRHKLGAQDWAKKTKVRSTMKSEIRAHFSRRLYILPVDHRSGPLSRSHPCPSGFLIIPLFLLLILRIRSIAPLRLTRVRSASVKNTIWRKVPHSPDRVGRAYTALRTP